MAIRGIGELDAENLCVLFCLAESVGRLLIVGFGFDNGYCEIRAVAKQVVGAFLFSANSTVASDDDATVRERSLLIYVLIGPAGRVEFREDVLAASVGFGV